MLVAIAFLSVHLSWFECFSSCCWCQCTSISVWHYAQACQYIICSWNSL